MNLRVLAATGALAAAALAPALPVSAASRPVTVAHHLANPRQITFAPDGTLYAALSGSGAWHAQHVGGCATGPEGGTVCGGDTAGIERVVQPGGSATANHAQWGLFSMADKGSGKQDPPGSSAVGVNAVSFAPDGTEWAIDTFGPPPVVKGLPSWVRKEAGHLLRIAADGTVMAVADVAHYSLAHPKPQHAPDTDPYGVLALNDRVFVVDAANDTLLVWRHGKLSTLHVFPYRHGTGKDGSLDTVPTSLATDGKHLFVGTLASFVPGKAKVYELTLGGKVVRTFGGLSQITGVTTDGHGTLWVSELFGGQQGPFDSKGNPTGLVVKVRSDGSHSVVAHVVAPGGVGYSRGHLYVSTWSISPTLGDIERIR